jgi:4-amino-4-deoxy-L-arabinose transferase-like glycosyltransferase
VATVARAKISSADWRPAIELWMDGVEAGWAVPLLLVGFVAVWQAFLSIAYFGGDLHPDVLETWTFGRSLEWGYPKHPPLMGWVARAWTSVFPLSNWSFQLMALTNAALAMWIVDLLARRFVKGDKRLIVLFLLMLQPTYQFHAQRFNANAVLLAVWPLATYCFLRSFETRRLGWAVATGATAALAMLGKYYSLFLIASFAFAAILHPQRRAYFGSYAPWASLLTGLVALGPHLYWLVTTGAKPCVYALSTHAGKPFEVSLAQALLFLPGVALVLILPAAAWLLIAGEKLRRFRADFQALSDELWLLLLIAAGTMFFPPITAVAMGTDMQPIWALQGVFMLVILVVCGASYSIDRSHSLNLTAGMIGIALFAILVAAPVHALYRNSHPLHEGRNFYRPAAEELTRQWHIQSDVPLAVVGGDDDLALALAFYSPDHPLYENRLVNPRVKRRLDSARGWAALCFGDDAGCIGAMEEAAARTPRSVRSEFTVRSELLGQPGASQRFTAFIVLPSTTASQPDFQREAMIDADRLRQRPVSAGRLSITSPGTRASAGR